MKTLPGKAFETSLIVHFFGTSASVDAGMTKSESYKKKKQWVPNFGMAFMTRVPNFDMIY